MLAFALVCVFIAVVVLTACGRPATVVSIPTPGLSETGSEPSGPAVPSAPTEGLRAGASVVPSQPAPTAGVERVAPRNGEGIMSIVWRSCARSDNWYPNALANGITPPDYIVPLHPAGGGLVINCLLAPQRPPLPVAPAVVAPGQPVQAVAPAAWAHPLPGTCRPAGGGGEFGAPRDGGSRLHQGIDLGSANTQLPGSNVYAGMPVRAIGGGVITYAGYAGNAGNQVQESIGGGQVIVKYNHLSGFAVRSGAWVNPGQTVGYMGGTGNADGRVHLHLEIWTGGQPRDPVPFLAAVGVRIGC